MFGDVPSDYCEHEPFRLKLQGEYIVCECGMKVWVGASNDYKIRFFFNLIRNQEDRIKKLEKALANFLVD